MSLTGSPKCDVIKTRGRQKDVLRPSPQSASRPREVCMADPRLNGSHLCVARHDQYDAAVDEMLDDRGGLTAMFDPLTRLPRGVNTPLRRGALPPGGTYMLVRLADGYRHPLRVGINTVGRFL